MNIMERFSLSGKVALVTGGAGNYGSQITLALAQAGATVIIASRSLEKNQEYSDKLCKEGYKVFAECYNQEEETTILEMRDRIKEKFGKVDVLVNNSVFRGAFTGGFDGDIEGFTRSLKVNGSGFYALTRAIGTLMIPQNAGSIINIGSYMGDLGPNQTLYEGTNGTMGGWGFPDYFYHKGAMHNLTRFFAAYYGQYNIRCNCLSLGGLFNNQHPAFVENYSKATYLGRLANNEDIMGAIVYLASDASLYTTGTIIPIDGGYSAK
ncbi:MAG: SDR family oxidoreductase [Clostridia bacterium]|nr:SDR family oxidoreductase [Clostridia bacterium]